MDGPRLTVALCESAEALEDDWRAMWRGAGPTREQHTAYTRALRDHVSQASELDEAIAVTVVTLRRGLKSDRRRKLLGQSRGNGSGTPAAAIAAG